MFGIYMPTEMLGCCLVLGFVGAALIWLLHYGLELEATWRRDRLVSHLRQVQQDTRPLSLCDMERYTRAYDTLVQVNAIIRDGNAAFHYPRLRELYRQAGHDLSVLVSLT